ncbi:MAG: hypothetical protein GEU80_04830 [Dehalococcoidia bacterium]|nr:hypothetical protein [Dehalococcoidia bacterium]
MAARSHPPAIRLLGPSGCGKTTLGEHLVRVLGERGYRVATVKSAQKHESPPDHTGSDTARFQAAGALAGAGLFADGAVVRLPPVGLDAILALMQPFADLVLIEGFRATSLPALVFATPDEPAGEPSEATIALIVDGGTDECAGATPAYQRDDIPGIAGAVERWLATLER